MKKKVRKYAKDMTTIAVTGLGVGIAGVTASELGATEVGGALGSAAGKLTPIAAGLYTVKFASDVLNDATKKRKKGKRKTRGYY